MNLKDIIRLWQKTQEGHIDDCRKAQIYFSEVMWTLYENLSTSQLYDCNIASDEHEGAEELAKYEGEK